MWSELEAPRIIVNFCLSFFSPRVTMYSIIDSCRLVWKRSDGFIFMESLRLWFGCLIKIIIGTVTLVDSLIIRLRHHSFILVGRILSKLVHISDDCTSCYHQDRSRDTCRFISYDCSLSPSTKSESTPTTTTAIIAYHPSTDLITELLLTDVIPDSCMNINFKDKSHIWNYYHSCEQLKIWIKHRCLEGIPPLQD